MGGGGVICPDGTPLLFIFPTEERDYASTPHLHSGSTSPPHQPVSASRQAQDAQKGLVLHPIQKIFDQLLRLFEARYFRHKAIELDGDEKPFKGGSSKKGLDPATARELERALKLLHLKFKPIPNSEPYYMPAKPDPAVATRKAAFLNTHDAFLTIALDVAQNEVWPGKGKLSGRIDER